MKTKTKTTEVKRKPVMINDWTAESCPKKLRSKIRRRRRDRISPLLFSSRSLSSVVTDRTASLNSSAYLFGGENSCESSRVSDGVRSRTRSRKREFGEIRSYGENEFRRVTRSFARQRRLGESSGAGDVEIEVSETSCVESCSVLLEGSCFKSKNVEEIAEEDDESDAITRSEISSFQQHFPASTIGFVQSSAKNFNSARKSVDVTENKQFEATDLVSITSGDNSPSESKIQNVYFSVAETSLVSQSSDQISFDVTNSVPDLTCTEKLSYEDFTEESSNPETAAQLQLDVFQDYSDIVISSSEYSPSMYLESGSEFSERTEEDLFPSPTFSLFLEYREQFCRSIYPLNAKVSSEFQSADKVNLWRFEDAEDEESYQLLRSRERRQLYLRDYTAEYSATTDYGKLVLHQRVQMAHWMVEYSDANELHQETLFLGINLMDRVLSKGFFKNKSSLHIVGIACLTLAIRVEENQPYNSVRQKTFDVGSNMYTRSEVVAMEWLVQEVLNFQCFLPSIYNFLWFYLKAAKASDEIENTVKHLAVLSVLGHEQLSYWPSTVAASLVIIVAIATKQNAIYHRVMKTHVRTENDDLRDCIKSLQGLITYVI